MYMQNECTAHTLTTAFMYVVHTFFSHSLVLGFNFFLFILHHYKCILRVGLLPNHQSRNWNVLFFETISFLFCVRLYKKRRHTAKFHRSRYSALSTFRCFLWSQMNMNIFVYIYLRLSDFFFTLKLTESAGIKSIMHRSQCCNSFFSHDTKCNYSIYFCECWHIILVICIFILLMIQRNFLYDEK